MSFEGPPERRTPPQEGTPPHHSEPGASHALAVRPTVAFTNLRPPGRTPGPSSDTSEASVPGPIPDTAWGSGIPSQQGGSLSREVGGAARDEAGSRGRPAPGVRPEQESGARSPSGEWPNLPAPVDGQWSGLGSPLDAPSDQGSGQNTPSDAPSGKASGAGLLIDTTPSSQDSFARLPMGERSVDSSSAQTAVDQGSKEGWSAGGRSTPGSGGEREEVMEPRPVPTPSAPTALDQEMGARDQGLLRVPPPSRNADIWKTPFWIIEDFQAPRQPPPSQRGEVPGGPVEAVIGGGRDDPSAPEVTQRPPYYDLDPEDLESYRLFNSRTPPGVRDSELMDVPDEDVEFWGKFYFVGVEKARELIEERRRGQKVQ